MSMQSKETLRQQALARRDALEPGFRIETALAVAEAFPFSLVDVRDRIVSAFLPIQSEIDARPLMDVLREAGARLALPAFPDRKGPMVFRLLDRTAPLVPMGFGTFGPGDDQPEVQPDILITPLSVFDRRGNRIGYGKGHYDRALARLDATGPRLAIGLAFSVQEVEDIPAEPHDRPLDGVLTDRGFRSFRM